MRFAEPFPYTVIDGYLSGEVVAAINAEWPETWSRKAGKTSHRWHSQELGPVARRVVDQVDIGLLEQLTGIEGLFADPELKGGGLHCIPGGGYLKTHVDFNWHPKGWHRRVNMLIYLNEVWRDEWAGHLCLGRNQERRIAPEGGRAVIFETNGHSWHWHPEPLRCPEDVQRRSLALYFYTRTKPDAKRHTTKYED